MSDDDLIRRGDALAAIRCGDTVTRHHAALMAIPAHPVQETPITAHDTDKRRKFMAYMDDKRAAGNPRDAVLPAGEGRR
jgi:hypothetical protein